MPRANEKTDAATNESASSNRRVVAGRRKQREATMKRRLANRLAMIAQRFVRPRRPGAVRVGRRASRAFTPATGASALPIEIEPAQTRVVRRHDDVVAAGMHVDAARQST